MKKIILPLLLIVAIGSTQAQDSKAVFAAKEIVWYGLDFSKAKFVGQFDQGMGLAPANGNDIKNKWAGQWNALMVKEQPHFDLRKAFQKDNVIYDMEPSSTFNQKIDADECMTYNAGSKLEKSVIESMIKDYPDGQKKDGIGCCFFVEKFDKNLELATVYVTFFDIKTKKVLVCEKEEGKPVGVGMRNYWAGSIKSIIKQSEGDWGKWKKAGK